MSENMVAGSEVPYPSGSYTTAGLNTTKNISYRNVGVSIICSVKDAGDNPKLDLKLEISDALPPAKDSDAITFRKVSINSRASLSLGKPTTVSITEDPGSRHRFQVDVTATKLK
jgi:type II secretory pathway component GspD/PulD (secretin)